MYVATLPIAGVNPLPLVSLPASGNAVLLCAAPTISAGDANRNGVIVCNPSASAVIYISMTQGLTSTPSILSLTPHVIITPYGTENIQAQSTIQLWAWCSTTGVGVAPLEVF